MDIALRQKFLWLLQRSLRTEQPVFRTLLRYATYTGAAILRPCIRILLSLVMLISAVSGFADDSQNAAGGDVDFVKHIQPIFREHCLSCHGETTQESGYRLDIRDTAMQGGDVGQPPIVPGNSDASPLIRYVAGSDPDMRMPPAGSEEQQLNSAQLALLKFWIEQGAKWPNSASGVPVDRGTWWSLAPIDRPQIPDSTEENPIDAFIDAQLHQRRLTRSPEASPSTLLRRLYFDLIGLPPPPEEIQRFQHANDSSAWARQIDNLLESPRYAERWARHWLDIVHYGETHGYDKDQPREHAWPYRDYVIRAFQSDKPYARFVQEQIAGDVLFPGTRDGMEALGFLAAGPWDLIGHAEVPETKIDGQIARHMDRDDIVQNTMLTFTSMTVGCSQCHYHKFDAISQEDYYSLQAVFAAIDRTDVAYYRDDSIAKRKRELQESQDRVQATIAAIRQRLEQAAGPELQEIDRQIAAFSQPSAERPQQYGYHSSIAKTQMTTKWVQVDLGQSVAINRVELLPCYDDFNQIGPGFGFPVRFKVEASDDPDFKENVSLFSNLHCETLIRDFENPQLRPVVMRASNSSIAGRYVRVTAIKLAPRQDDYILALAELQVYDAQGNNVAFGNQVTALDSVEAPPRWQRNNLTDGLAPLGSSAVAQLERLAEQRQQLLEAVTDTSAQQQVNALELQLERITQDLSVLPPPDKVYVGAVHTGTGNFRGTGNEGGRPREIRILSRGDVSRAGRIVTPGALSVIQQLPARFELDENHGEGERRRALALWLTNPENPLTWRTIVNRVWQFHFGRGLVDTPNDFGRNGATPSHPELLDWLAARFRDEGGSLKSLHRWILTSKTYRQSSAVHSAGTEIDSENVYLWRMNRTKLDAEAIRDSMLLVSGKLDLRMGGPSFYDFKITSPQHSPHYEYDLYDPEDPATHRRSIYRFIVRSQLNPFMTALDCADPSMQVDKRNESLSPIQALALLNDALVITMSKHFAARVAQECDSLDCQVRHAFRLGLSRDPTAAELQAYCQYADSYGMENMCRVIFNLNEFAFVD